MMIHAKTDQQNENSLLISWNNTIESEYCLQILNAFKEWTTLYRGYRTSYIVKNLYPCEVYSFRVKSLNSEWYTFKSATSEGISYTTRHLFSAMRSQKFALIRKIIKMRPELLETENKKSNTPLIQAITDNDFKMVNLLLHLRADINKPLMHSGKTPLLVAISHGFPELAKFLISKGASVQAVDINGLGVMHYSVNSEKLEMICYFVDLGLEVNKRDKNGLTPLLRAVILDLDGEIIRFLIENGADPNICDENGFDFYKHQCLNTKEVIVNISVPKFILCERL